MKKILLILVGIVLLLCVLGAVVFFVAVSPEPEPTTGPGATQFPSGSSLDPSSAPSGKLLVYTRGSGTLELNDFIRDGITIEDKGEAGTYVLVGELGYCLPDGSCPRATDHTDFSITYTTEGDIFTIALLAEPLSTTRLRAEQYLKERLGISAESMCGLNYYVGTPSWVNEHYSNGNMGFSFCDDAAKLP
ncbi:MAG: hypothetical protein AAB582_01490 [Patescibacteria group bacterium]